MNIYINNHLREVNNQKTISQLLIELQLSQSKGIAVAVNNEVIPKKSWENHSVCENDRVTVIKATQGG